MLIPLRPGELQRLIPAVATGNQFKYALGNARKILQRIMISSITGVITLLISQGTFSGQFDFLWLMIGIVCLLYILWDPIIEASRKNSTVRKYPFSAIFYGEIGDVYIKEKIENRHEQANRIGELEVVENRRTWMFIDLYDEDGYLDQLSFPMEKNHNIIRQGLKISCIVLSSRKDFSVVSSITDAWLPSQRIWLGDYPFLLRPAFEELCNRRVLMNR